LLDRQKRLENTIKDLERERSGILATLQANTLSEETFQDIQDFTRKVSQGLDKADSDFQTQRQVIEALDVTVTLSVEDGQKIVYLQWIPGFDSRLPLPTPSLPSVFDNTILKIDNVR